MYVFIMCNNIIFSMQKNHKNAYVYIHKIADTFHKRSIHSNSNHRHLFKQLIKYVSVYRNERYICSSGLF